MSSQSSSDSVPNNNRNNIIFNDGRRNTVSSRSASARPWRYHVQEAIAALDQAAFSSDPVAFYDSFFSSCAICQSSPRVLPGCICLECEADYRSHLRSLLNDDSDTELAPPSP